MLIETLHYIMITFAGDFYVVVLLVLPAAVKRKALELGPGVLLCGGLFPTVQRAPLCTRQVPGDKQCEHLQREGNPWT